MATLVNTNLKISSGEFFERDIVWVQTTLDITSAANLLQAVKTLQTEYSISIIGTPTSTGCTFACHGPSTISTEMEAAFDVIGTQTLSVVSLSGVTFA